MGSQFFMTNSSDGSCQSVDAGEDSFETQLTVDIGVSGFLLTFYKKSIFYFYPWLLTRLFLMLPWSQQKKIENEKVPICLRRIRSRAC